MLDDIACVHIVNFLHTINSLYYSEYFLNIYELKLKFKNRISTIWRQSQNGKIGKVFAILKSIVGRFSQQELSMFFSRIFQEKYFDDVWRRTHKKVEDIDDRNKIENDLRRNADQEF